MLDEQGGNHGRPLYRVAVIAAGAASVYFIASPNRDATSPNALYGSAETHAHRTVPSMN